jgi:hypothetical protein
MEHDQICRVKSKRKKSKKKQRVHPLGHFLPPIIFVASLDWHPHANAIALARACFWFSDFFVFFCVCGDKRNGYTYLI